MLSYKEKGSIASQQRHVYIAKQILTQSSFILLFKGKKRTEGLQQYNVSSNCWEEMASPWEHLPLAKCSVPVFVWLHVVCQQAWHVTLCIIILLPAAWCPTISMDSFWDYSSQCYLMSRRLGISLGLCPYESWKWLLSCCGSRCTSSRENRLQK